MNCCYHLCKTALTLFSESLRGIFLKNIPVGSAPRPPNLFVNWSWAGCTSEMCDYFASWPEAEVCWRNEVNQYIDNQHHFLQSGVSKKVTFLS